MPDNHLFHKILFPVDFSNSSQEAIEYVVKLAQTFRADLVLLHTFRLSEGIIKNVKLGEKKKMIESDAYNHFKIIEERYLIPRGIKYFFQSEIGFVYDRIVTNVNEHAIDLVILRRSILEKEYMAVKKVSMFNDIDCPVMLIS